jgi:hypothetical protein
MASLSASLNAIVRIMLFFVGFIPLKVRQKYKIISDIPKTVDKEWVQKNPPSPEDWGDG